MRCMKECVCKVKVCNRRMTLKLKVSQGRRNDTIRDGLLCSMNDKAYKYDVYDIYDSTSRVIFCFLHQYAMSVFGLL